MPHLLRLLLTDCEAVTVDHQGWASIKNESLLGKAEQAGFKVLLTADQSMSFQQSIKGRALGLVVLNTPDWSRIRPKARLVMEAILRCTPGSVIDVEI